MYLYSPFIRAAMMVVPMGRTLRGAVEVYSKTSPGLRMGCRPVTPSPWTTSLVDEPTVWISNLRERSWMVSVGELLVMRMVYWKQCFLMGGSDCSVLYELDTSTVTGPVVALLDASVGMVTSPMVTSESPGRRGRPPDASAVAFSLALAAAPLGLASSATSSSLSWLSSSSSKASGSPPASTRRRCRLTSSLASWRALSKELWMSVGMSGTLPSCSLARSSRFFLSSSSSPMRRAIIRSRRSLASRSSELSPPRILSSNLRLAASWFLRASADMALWRLTRSSMISCSIMEAWRPGLMPMS
mmetsp:Transcript_22840/g.54175  ORF Transcript_22840/g.54175 Transcript_22840/m.54175 type:complete len:301 (-) Transcript_22840:865-1767(-)